jgi:hypothetical protein
MSAQDQIEEPSMALRGNAPFAGPRSSFITFIAFIARFVSEKSDI